MSLRMKKKKKKKVNSIRGLQKNTQTTFHKNIPKEERCLITNP